MEIGVVSGLETSMIDDARDVYSTLIENGIEPQLEEKLADSLRNNGKSLKKMAVDVMIIVGSDRTLLNTLLSLGNYDTPILPISSKGQPDFLFDIVTTDFETIVKDFLDGRWSEDRRARIVANISGNLSPPLLNDLAIFSRRSATLLRYSLILDGERFLKDGSDGLIIATPTGSTAYSMSVGGPVILSPARVLSVISVNSVNPARRPIVVADDMTIEIRDLSSSVAIEAILDGQIRKRVNEASIIINRAESDAVFVKFSEEKLAALHGKLVMKTEVFEDRAQDLPPSAKLVLKILEYQGELTQKAIIEHSMLPSRTVRYALSLLISEHLVEKRISLRDSRQGLYRVKRNAGKREI